MKILLLFVNLAGAEVPCFCGTAFELLFYHSCESAFFFCQAAFLHSFESALGEEREREREERTREKRKQRASERRGGRE